LLAIGVGVLLTVVYLSPLRDYAGRAREIRAYLRGFGLWAPLVLAGGIAVLVAVGFPRLLFCVLAGMTLGFWQGLFWAQLGTLVGNYAVFMVARFGGGAWVQAYVARRGKLHGLVRQEGIAGVILARQLPLPGLLINLACGLLSLRHRDFLVGTVVGQLPEAIPCTLIGAGVIAASFSRTVGAISLAVIFAVLLWAGLRVWLRRV
jgi:uncharacterized membrane protein YdjX (TVP38/TMEM64 family)